jgi:glycosyltransferase involved in cell wall biosynthesis
LISQRGIICLSTIDWDFLWQRQQELMTRFARSGVPVLYVEPLGVRSARISDARKIGRRVRRWIRQGMHAMVNLQPGLCRLSPYALPIQGNGMVDALNGRLVGGAIRRAARSMGLRSPVLWTYYATSATLRLADALQSSVIVYDCIDDVARNPKGVVSGYAETERALLQRADLVLTTSSSLYADKSPFNAHTYLVPPGANSAHFAAPASGPDPLGPMAHPRLCFFGGVDERIDLSMLAAIARRRPEWQIVLVGVVRTDVSSLANLGNIVFAGQQSYHDLPAYLQWVDLLLLPYLVNDYTRRIYPAKVFECLASGKPVLATRLPELEQLSGQVRLLAPEDDPVTVIEHMLAQDSPEDKQRRQALAAANTWDARFADVQNLLNRTLAGKGSAA